MRSTKSNDEKLIKLFLDELQKRTKGLTWITDTEEKPFPGPTGIWLIDDKNEIWLFEVRSERDFLYMNKKEFDILLLIPKSKEDVLMDATMDWVYSQTGIRPTLCLDYDSDQIETVKKILSIGVPYKKQD